MRGWRCWIARRTAHYLNCHDRESVPRFRNVDRRPVGRRRHGILLAQSGSTVAGAYQILVSMSIISYFMPYLFTFASVLRMQRTPAGPDVIRPPGGRITATILASVGFAVTLVSMLLACVPDAAEPNKPLAVLKVVGSMVLLVAIGQIVYMHGQRQRRGQVQVQ